MSEYCHQRNYPENDDPEKLRSFENEPEFPPDRNERLRGKYVVDQNKDHEAALAGDEFERQIAIETAFEWGIHDAVEGAKNTQYRDTRTDSDTDGYPEVPFSELDEYYTRGLKNGSLEDGMASVRAKQRLRAEADDAEDKAAARYDAVQSGN